LPPILRDAFTIDPVALTLPSPPPDVVVDTGGGGGPGGGYYSRKRWEEDCRLARLALEEARKKRGELSAKAPKKALAKAIYAAADILREECPTDGLGLLTELLRDAAEARSGDSIIEAANAVYAEAIRLRDDDEAILWLIL
jgi:hypothetical protein